MIWSLVTEAWRRLKPQNAGEVKLGQYPANLIDRRSHAAQSHHGYKTRARKLSAVSGVCLHQSACLLGERPERYDTVGAHVCVTRAGQIIWLHDFDRFVVHGNGFNSATVGIEIDGRFRGVTSRPETGWHGANDTPTEAQLDAARRAVKWIVEEVAAHGGRVNALVAHRQSSGTRRSDPGEAVWRSVALPCSAELGLSDGGPGFRLGDGAPIPREWDERRTARY